MPEWSTKCPAIDAAVFTAYTDPDVSAHFTALCSALIGSLYSANRWTH